MRTIHPQPISSNSKEVVGQKGIHGDSAQPGCIQDAPILLNAALHALAMGFSVLPVKQDKSPAVHSWKRFQHAPMTSTEARRFFASAEGLALICGKVSGDLECLDIDDPDIFQSFGELLEVRCPGLFVRLLQRKTPHGFHLVYRCQSQIQGNTKLAFDQHGKVRLETRGEGGYFLTVPSPHYAVLAGNLKDCPVLSFAEVDAIHQVAKAFDERDLDIIPSVGNSHIDSPGSHFNQTHRCAEILTANGWHEWRRTTAGIGYTRPGKEQGVSGVLLNKTGNFYVWSANAAPLQAGKSYSPFGLYAVYEHGGDLSAAARLLTSANKLSGQNRKQTVFWRGVEATVRNRGKEPMMRDWPVMHPKAHRGIAGEFVHLATRDSEADPAAVLATFMVRFGVECGPDVFMRVGDTRHHARLAAVIVGSSSKARKGTSGKPVQKLFDFDEIHPGDQHPPALSKARESPGPFSSGEGIIFALRDATYRWNEKEQVQQVVDPGVGDKRLFVLDEEFAGVLANTKREGNVLSMVIRQAWDSGNFDPLTKNNKITATGGHVGWVGHITLAELRLKFDLSEGLNGFANRILWVCAHRSKLVPLPVPMPEEELGVLRWKLMDILHMIRKGGEIRLGDAAKNAWVEHYYRELSREMPGLIGCITSRAEAQALRLAMLYALLDGQNVISLDHLEAAIEFWKYCQQSVNVIFQGRQLDSTAQKLLEAMQKGPMTGTEMHALFSNNISRERLETALSELIASGSVECIERHGTKGRPMKIYQRTAGELNEKNEETIEDERPAPINFVNSFNSFETGEMQEFTI